jgi:hypothetical protein
MLSTRRTARGLAAASSLGLLFLVSFSVVLGGGSAGPLSPAVVRPYAATFQETGLPGGTSWSVHVNSVGCVCSAYSKTLESNTDAISFDLSNGTYHYVVERVAGYFVAGPDQGSFNVSGANLTLSPVSFRPVLTYLTEFAESGLPNGTLWTVTVHGNGTGQLAALEDLVGHSYTTSLNLTLPNGSYRYTVEAVNGSFFEGQSSHGAFRIDGAAPAPIAVTWTTPPTYAVTFHESGLPPGMNWTVRVAGLATVPIHQTRSSTGANITFYLPTGSYRYAVADVLFFDAPAPAAGSFPIGSAGTTFNVTFVASLPDAFYPVAFTETGLANGTHWWVGVVVTSTFGHSRSTFQSSNGTTMFFLLPNGSYRFLVHGPRTYTISSGGSGRFTIAGSSPAAFVVSFSAIPTYTVTFTETGLPNGTAWSVLVRSTSTTSTPWLIHVTETSDTASMTFTLPSGGYCFKFDPVPGYRQTSGAVAGSFAVSGGSPAPIAAGFSPT